YRDTPGDLTHRLLDLRGKLLDDKDFFVLPDKIPHPLLVDRVRTDLHEGNALWQQFLDIGCPDPASYDRGLSMDLVPVESCLDKPLPDRRLFFVEFFVEDTGMGRDHHVLPGVLVELPFPQTRDSGPQLHVTFRMADTCRGPE